MLVIKMLALGKLFKILTFVIRSKLFWHDIQYGAFELLLGLNSFIIIVSKIKLIPKYFIGPFYLPKTILYINDAHSNFL
jgi:hypothetical protein